jgi:hypothetical protein
MVKYVGTYSLTQKAYDIRTLEETLKINNKMIAKGINTGFQILCIENSYEKASKYLEQYERRFDRPTEKENHNDIHKKN